MNIGYLGMKNSFSMEMVTRLQAECPGDRFVEWPPAGADQTSELDVLIAMGPVKPELFKAQAKLGLLQMASAGYDGVDVEAATEAGVWVASAPTGKTGNGESVAEHAVLLMLAAARRLNEELAFSRAGAGEQAGESAGEQGALREDGLHRWPWGYWGVAGREAARLWDGLDWSR